MPAEKNRLNEVCYVRYIKNFFKQNSQIRVYQCHMSKVHSVDWNVDGRKLASGRIDQLVLNCYACFAITPNQTSANL